MKSITRTKGKIKMYVKINRYGQPCGLKTCNFTNFIATLVKGGDLSLREKDWRKVEDKKKIWTLVNKYFTIDPICEEWVLTSAGKKWRDFKNTLKKKYFDANLNEQENIAKGCRNRIPTPDWEWLVNYWCKEETKEMVEPMGQQLQSLSSNNKVHVDELKQTRVRNLGQKQRTSGLDVALRSPSSSNIVAYGRLGRTDKDAKAADGLPLGGFYEVFVDVVDKQFSLPRAQGQATKMGSALGHCIAWPFQNVVQKDGSPLNISKRATDCHK